MRLKVIKLDELKASILYEDLKLNIDWKKVKQMKALYKKAIKYLNESSYEIYYEYDETNRLERYEFVWRPVKGYNKSFRIVTLTINLSKDVLEYFGCNCDGFRKNKICSHVLATYIVLKKQNQQMRKEIEDAVRSLMKDS